MEKIKEIYKSIMQETEDMKRQRKILEHTIEAVLKRSEYGVCEENYEKRRDTLYEVAMAAEEGGFLLGFRYSAQLMAECYDGKLTAESE